MASASTKRINDFIILGPEVASRSKVLEAIYALYFLPDNFKLILTGSQKTDQSFYKELVAAVDECQLDGRVRFTDQADSMDAVILPNAGMVRASNAVAGDSPEALASAILDVSRA
jgi:hypothetical protein